MFNRLYTLNEVIKCSREEGRFERCHVKTSEVVWFTSNQRVLLSTIGSAITYSLPSKNVYGTLVNVFITAIGNDYSREVLHESQYNDERFIWRRHAFNDSYLNIISPQPVLIEPKTIYEIKLTLSELPNEANCQYLWDPKLELENGLIIRFLRNPAFTSYDTSTSGWISYFEFNRV